MAKRTIDTVVHLTDVQREKLAEAIRAFYVDVRDEEVGIVEEQQLIDLFCEQMAPIVYNKALDDAMAWLKAQANNIELDYFSLYRNTD